MLKVTATITGGDIAVAIRGATARLLQTEPLVQALVNASAEGQRRNIDESHTPTGEAFEKLKPATMREKARKGYPLTPLKRTLVMYNSIRGQVISPREGSAGPGDEALYAKYANARRQFVGTGREDGTVFQRIVDDFAIAAVNEAYIDAATGIR